MAFEKRRFKMKAKVLILSALFFLLRTVPAIASCGFSWHPYSLMAFECINIDGQVHFTEHLGSMLTSDGETLPLYANFNSGRKTASNLLGYGWWFGITDCTIVKSGRIEYTVTFPDNTTNMLRPNKNSKQKNVYDSDSWAFVEGSNPAVLNGKCGVEVFFKGGVMVKQKTSSGVTIEFNYLEGRLFSISEKGKDLVRFEYNKDLDIVTIKFVETKQTTILNLISISESRIDKILSSIQYSDGKKIKYLYNFKEKTRWSLNREISPHQYAEFIWNTANGRITRENFCRDGKNDIFLYTYKLGDFGGLHISRILHSTRKEDIFCSNKTGIVQQRSNGGPIVTTHNAMTNSAFGKPKRIVSENPDNGEVEEIVYTYDDKGRIIREILNGKVLYNIKYNDKEHSIIYHDSDWKQLWKKIYDDQDRVVLYEMEDGKIATFKYLKNEQIEATLVKNGKATTTIFNESLN